jgi:hypothetical protein
MKPAHGLTLAVLAAILLTAPVALAQSSVEQARIEYEARQARIRCAAHPEQGCLTQPETENQRAMREYRERQLRLKCAAHPHADECH